MTGPTRTDDERLAREIAQAGTDALHHVPILNEEWELDIHGARTEALAVLAKARELLEPSAAPEAPDPDEKRGLYRKYRVERVSDPTGKHAGCEYYVLDWKHDPYAIPAALAYADACVAKFPVLAESLRCTASYYSNNVHTQSADAPAAPAPPEGEPVTKALGDVDLPAVVRLWESRRPAAPAERGRVMATVEINGPDDALLGIVDMEPGCGEVFCDTCGDCCHCYGGEACFDGSGEYDEGRSHRFIKYLDEAESRVWMAAHTPAVDSPAPKSENTGPSVPK